MKTYSNLIEFESNVFPSWFEKDVKKKKTDLEERIEYIDSIFQDELEKAIKGKKLEKEETVKGKKAEKKEQKPSADNT